MSWIQQWLIASYPAPASWWIPTSGLVNEWLLHSDANDSVGSFNVTTSWVTYWTVWGKSAATFATNAYWTNTSFYINSSSISITFWIYLSDLSATQYLLKSDWATWDRFFIRIIDGTNLQVIDTMSWWDTAAHIALSNISTSTWTMITMISTGANTKSYVWTTLIWDSTTSWWRTTWTTAENFNIWWYGTSWWLNPHWSMRDVRIYNRVLTSQELTDIYNVG